MPKTLKADAKMRQFQEDLLQSVREFKAGKFARVTQVQTTAAAQAHASVGLSQARFAFGGAQP